MTTLANEFDRAFRLHQQGKLREAFMRYDAILKADPKHAAAQIGAMDEPIAVSILHKLNVRAASSILDQMEAARAARLTSLILAAPAPEKKS